MISYRSSITGACRGSGKAGSKALGNTIGKTVVLIALISQLASCGYQLRGSSTPANGAVTVSELGPLYIDTVIDASNSTAGSGSGNAAFYTLLRSKLQAASITLTTERAKSRYRLKVYGFQSQQHPLSYASNGDVSEYRHQASLAFKLTDANNFSAINATRLKAEEIVRSNQNGLAADRAKTAQLRRELAHKLVDQIYWALKTASIKHNAVQPRQFTTPAK